MYCEKCGTELSENAKFCISCGKVVSNVAEEQTLAKTEYFSVSSARLITLSILTFNLYELYWFYKNWHAVKDAQSADISPFWRAIFSIFFCHDFFKRALRSANEHGYDSNAYSPGWLAGAYVILLFIGNVLGRIDIADGAYLFWFLVVLILTPLPLLPVQRAINYNNARIKVKEREAGTFTTGEVILIIIGIILMGLIVFSSL